MPAFRTPRFHAAAAALLTALTVAFAGPAAPAGAAPKGGAPTLTIESKACTIGATEEERSVTVTALALLGATGDRVTMRFSLQSRQGKAKWKSVLFKDPTTTKKWETTEALRAGLKLTKVIPNLPEGYRYRVAVESRGVDEAGKVVTKTSKKYVLCNQPLFTPTLTLSKVRVLKQSSSSNVEFEGPSLEMTIRNLGRLPSKGLDLTIADGATRAPLSKTVLPSIKGGGSARWIGPLPKDCTKLYITVQEAGADPSALTVEQSATVDCAVGQQSRATTSRRR